MIRYCCGGRLRPASAPVHQYFDRVFIPEVAVPFDGLGQLFYISGHLPGNNRMTWLLWSSFCAADANAPHASRRNWLWERCIVLSVPCSPTNGDRSMFTSHIPHHAAVGTTGISFVATSSSIPISTVLYSPQA